MDSKNGSRLYNEDPRFAELIDSGRFVYTGCVVCLNDPLYIKKTDDPSYPQGYALTDFALEHVDFCCLKFTRHYTRDDQAFEYYDACGDGLFDVTKKQIRLSKVLYSGLSGHLTVRVGGQI